MIVRCTLAADQNFYIQLQLTLFLFNANNCCFHWYELKYPKLKGIQQYTQYTIQNSKKILLLWHYRSVSKISLSTTALLYSTCFEA